MSENLSGDATPGKRFIYGSRIWLVAVAGIRWMSFCLFLQLCILRAPAHAQTVPSQEELNYANSLSSAFEKVADVITPTMVNISSVKHVKVSNHARGMRDPFFDQFRDFFGEDLFNRFAPNNGPEGFAQQGLGSGVIVDTQGYILTNNHVIGDADEVLIRTHDDRKFKAEVVGADPRTDLAVVRIKAGDLSAAKLGDSDNLKIGEWVVAAGNPFGLNNSITAGIVSAKGRSISGGGQYEDFIQTDAAINPGNSGGPLVNLKGEVVGINTAIFSKSGGYMGIGFAIPINMAKSVMESLISRGRVIRGWLGIGIQNLTEDLAQSFNHPSTEGALVGHVEQGGPAEKAGIQQGDIVIELDGHKIRDMNMLRNSVASLHPGNTVPMSIIRNGRKVSIDVKIGELPAQRPPEDQSEPEATSSDIGISVEDLTPELARRLGSKKREGVVVSKVKQGSVAAQAGLQRGDIITSVNGKTVNNVGDFSSTIGKGELQKGIRIVIENQGMERFVFLRSNE